MLKTGCFRGPGVGKAAKLKLHQTISRENEDASCSTPALPCGCAGSPDLIARCGSNSISRVPAPDRPPQLSPNFLAHSSSPPAVLQTGSPLFCVDLLENVNLHRLVRHQTLEPRVLFFHCSEPLGFAHFHASKLPLPRVVGRRADIMRCADRLYRTPGLRFS